MARLLRGVARDLLILAVSATGLPFVRLARLRSRGPLLRVLTFHDVPEEDGARFARMISRLRRRYNVISPADFEARRLDPGRVNVLLTFDDGYASWRSVALPVLEREGLRGIFFLSSGFLDAAGDAGRELAFCRDRLRIRHRRPLSWEDAALLAEHGVVGGHSLTHPVLAGAGDLEREIGDDKRAIERRLGVELGHFAYPFGMRQHLDERAAAAVARAGYRYGFASRPGFVDGDMLRIPRLSVDPDRSLLLLELSILGAYDLVRRLVEWREA